MQPVGLGNTHDMLDDRGKYFGIIHVILSVPHNIVKDMKNAKLSFRTNYVLNYHGY